ncbi:tetratricopeptide repeat protein [Corynebacterium uropygiale]|uniref:Tetratricopeptide repeat protein n=1 Tax=Corynebacterium uropygiale TaxID=1775911 RepID=A0A9X1QPF0_9CORY|nr:tetratricopeptide repeat protein [Corynebacterium uropygiale]MCF4006716.1 tetratricopeptide repeat protein [Corynebacterium uropygiale]
MSAKDLDPLVRQDLRVLSKDNADRVAKHMVAAAMFMDEDPELALRHARAAKDRGGRVAVTRETCGIAAYRAGHWKEALSELRAARRMSGGPGLVAVMADCERGLGRPAKAIEMAETPEAAELDADSTLELAIVVAGGRQDMGDYQAAVTILEHQNPNAPRSAFEATRIAYAYAGALELVGDIEKARTWFQRAVELDEDGLTDAELRLHNLQQKDSTADDAADKEGEN